MPLTNLFATLPASESDAQKVAPYNAALQIIDSAIAGRLAISTTGGTIPFTGTVAAPQAQNMFFDISGALTSDAILPIPISATSGRNRIFIVRNGTSGAHIVTIRVVGSSAGVTVDQGNTAFLLYNGTDIAYAAPQIVSATGAVATASGGSGDIGTAWTVYAPSITTSVGTITALGTVSGRYKKTGKTVFFQVSIAITTNGTGAGYVLATLPFTAAAFEYTLAGAESNTTGVQLRGLIPSSGTQVRITKYDATYPGADGYRLVISGVYESV